MCNEVSQMEKDKNYISFTWGISKIIQMNIYENRKTHRQKRNLWLTMGGGGKEKSRVCN